VISRDMTAVAEADQDEERGAWLRLDTGELAVRVRHLGDLLKRGVTVTDARLVQDAEENWTIWVRLSDRPGEYRVNQVRLDQPKTYKDLGLAVDTVWSDFGYKGTIVLSTERRRAPRPRPDATA
jgi:hypothetical protein